MAHDKQEEEDTSLALEEKEKDHGGLFSAEESASSSPAKDRPQSAMSCLLPADSLRSTTAIPAAQAQSQANNSGGIRSLSFSKLLSFRVPSSLSTLSCIDQLDADAAAEKQICRSQSVPTSVRRFNAKAGLRRVGPAAAGFRVVSDDPEAAAGKEAEDIAAEEAVCRICMVALSESEGEAVLKLECCCKGELALAHRSCAIKWFSIKGNGACDVCGQEVLNLPVTLHGHHPAAAQAQEATQQQQPAPITTSRYRVWHGTPILVIISMLAYFCFLEQLLVGDHGTAALAISLPFACVLGLFSSLTTTKMVSRRYVWIYSAVQFLFIVLFTNLFYRYVRMQAVIAIILSTFAGFSMAICANSVLLQILRWRARRAASPTMTEDQQEPRDQREPPMVDLEIAPPLP
ncbi:hypothetical protein EJB05_25569 [Eragrostis curvula]|uniref:RING-CH-type domain-containing protein n=1 Tax=Eragrostis curvula TaxID=38414 RepID=A0A5J9VCP3_9POAL|nr:hypothetical protein EJB05_25569 [Eragrostis curvula]